MKNVKQFCYTSMHDLPQLLWDNIGSTGDYSLVLRPDKKAPKKFDFEKVYAQIFDAKIKEFPLSDTFKDLMKARITANDHLANSVIKNDASLLSFARRAEREAAAILKENENVKLSTVCGQIFKQSGQLIDPSVVSVYMFNSVLKSMGNG